MEKVTFKVRMNNEAESLPVEVNLEVDTEGLTVEQLLPYAMRSYKIELQGQCRPNWDRFIKGEYSKTLKFGEALFTSTKGKVSVEKAKVVYAKTFDGMSEEDKLIKLFEDKLISEEMFNMLMDQVG